MVYHPTIVYKTLGCFRGMSKPAYVYVGAMVSTKMKDEVNQIIEQGRFTTESELFRTALRALLDNLKEEAV